MHANRNILNKNMVSRETVFVKPEIQPEETLKTSIEKVLQKKAFREASKKVYLPVRLVGIYEYEGERIQNDYEWIDLWFLMDNTFNS